MNTDDSSLQRLRRRATGGAVLSACTTLLAVLLAFAAPSAVPARAETQEPQRPETPEPQRPEPSQAEPAGTEQTQGPGAQSERRAGAPQPGKPRLPEWRLEVTSGNQAELEVSEPAARDARVKILRPLTGLPWHVRLAKGPFSIEATEIHLVEFRARSDGVRTISMSVVEVRPPFKNLSPQREFEITPMWSMYRGVVRVPGGADRARLQFFVGGSRHSVEITELSLVRVADGTDVLRTPFVPKPVEPREAPTEAPSAEPDSGSR